MLKCSCGAIISKNSLFKHLKSTKHLERLQLIREVTTNISKYYRQEMKKSQQEVDLIKNTHSIEYTLYHLYELDKIKEQWILDLAQPFDSTPTKVFILEWDDDDEERYLQLDDMISWLLNI
jgi:hypothetical protein